MTWPHTSTKTQMTALLDAFLWRGDPDAPMATYHALAKVPGWMRTPEEAATIVRLIKEERAARRRRTPTVAGTTATVSDGEGVAPSDQLGAP